MGHTLIANCEHNEFEKVKELLCQSFNNVNKIPYGRGCDRYTANMILPYHMTVFHWGKEYDMHYLERIRTFSFKSFSIAVTGINNMLAEEESNLIYFSINPDNGYADFQIKAENALSSPLSSFLHITIDVNKNQNPNENNTR